MPRKLPKALREACTAPKRHDLVYRGAVAVRDVLRLLWAWLESSSWQGMVGAVLLPLSAATWLVGVTVIHDGAIQIMGVAYFIAAIALLFAHSEIKRRR